MAADVLGGNRDRRNAMMTGQTQTTLHVVQDGRSRAMRSTRRARTLDFRKLWHLAPPSYPPADLLASSASGLTKIVRATPFQRPSPLGLSRALAPTGIVAVKVDTRPNTSTR